MSETPAIRPGERRLGLLFFKLDSSDSPKQGVIAAEIYLALNHPDALQNEGEEHWEERRKARKLANQAIKRYSNEKGFVTQAEYKKQRASVPAIVSMAELQNLLALMRDARNPVLLTQFNLKYLPLLKQWLDPEKEDPEVIHIDASPGGNGQPSTGSGSPSTSQNATSEVLTLLKQCGFDEPSSQPGKIGQFIAKVSDWNQFKKALRFFEIHSRTQFNKKATDLAKDGSRFTQDYICRSGGKARFKKLDAKKKRSSSKEGCKASISVTMGWKDAQDIGLLSSDLIEKKKADGMIFDEGEGSTLSSFAVKLNLSHCNHSMGVGTQVDMQGMRLDDE